MDLEPGIPSKCESSTHADYVPALDTREARRLPHGGCTRGTMRPEMARKSQDFAAAPSNCGKFLKLHLPSRRGNASAAGVTT